jgi:hypothetical protein
VIFAPSGDFPGHSVTRHKGAKPEAQSKMH